MLCYRIIFKRKQKRVVFLPFFSSLPYTYLVAVSVWGFFGEQECVGIRHSISDEKKASLAPLDRLKKLRSPGEADRELDWSRSIPVVRWFSSEGAIFLKNTPVSLWSLYISQLTFCLCVGMINAPWHSFCASREGHWYLLLDSKISSNLSKNTKGVTFTEQDRCGSWTPNQCYVFSWGVMLLSLKTESPLIKLE